MSLRIYRTYTWELDCPTSEIRFGGSNPMKLVAHDRLQYNDGEHWIDIPVVEAEKPARPMSYREQRFKHNEYTLKDIAKLIEGGVIK